MRLFWQTFLAFIFTVCVLVLPAMDIETAIISQKPESSAITAFKSSGSIFAGMGDVGLKRALTSGYVQKIGREVAIFPHIFVVDELIADATRVAVSFYFYSEKQPVDNEMGRLEVELDLPGAFKHSTFTGMQGENGGLNGYVFSEYTGNPREIVVKGKYKDFSGSEQEFNIKIPFKLTATNFKEIGLNKKLGGSPEVELRKIILAPTQWVVVVNLRGSREELEAFRNLNLPVKLYSDGNPLELLGVGSSLGGIPPKLDEYFYFQPGGQEKGALVGVSWPDGNYREMYVDFTVNARQKPKVEITPFNENIPGETLPKTPPERKEQSSVPVSKPLTGIEWVKENCRKFLAWIPEKNYGKIREIAEEQVVLAIKDAFSNFQNYKLELVNFNYQENQKGYIVSLYVEIRNAQDNSYLGSSELMLQFTRKGEGYKLIKFSKN
ncbi:hypothetical protein [Carboxydothermus ferrireducens]|uniref:Uncharacterized protein n=1 Tax=Carboxydothermus ferrireducens DSM 11255 TaxID=1119529 RepID=A0ABX2R8B5_9THEO|nr:hypothetical protein [Carboxydothermus ferrireducens]NYE57404.1 hypothetical protein [Carboxydothermus ferrireducens DSM 11255]